MIGRNVTAQGAPRRPKGWSALAFGNHSEQLAGGGTLRGHPPLTSPDRAQPGGLLLFFGVGDFDEALVRAHALVDRLDQEPHRNPSTGTREFARRDPGVTVSALARGVAARQPTTEHRT